VANLRHIDAVSEFRDLGIEDVVDLYFCQRNYSQPLGLWAGGRRHVHRYVRDKLLNPLSLLQTKDDKAAEVIVVEDDETDAREVIENSSAQKTNDETTPTNDAGKKQHFSDERVREVCAGSSRNKVRILLRCYDRMSYASDLGRFAQVTYNVGS